MFNVVNVQRSQVLGFWVWLDEAGFMKLGILVRRLVDILCASNAFDSNGF